MRNKALDPNNKPTSILATPDGKLVTDLYPKPPVTVPITQVSLRVDSQGRVIIYKGV